MIEVADVDRVLADPAQTRQVVIAAGRALNALLSADASGRTPDGDEAVMSARSTLRSAFADLSGVEALAESNRKERERREDAERYQR